MVTWISHSLCYMNICKLDSRQVMQFLRPNKKNSVIRVTGLKILGRVGTHIFLSKQRVSTSGPTFCQFKLFADDKS